MDTDSLIRAQVRALKEQLDWAEKSLGEADIAKHVRAAAKNGFGVLFNTSRGELELMEKKAVGEHSWKNLSKYSQDCANLFQECLGFLGGALMRGKETEGDICDIADALLHELSLPETVKWNGVTLLAEANFFTETTGLVRLPFPDYGIWNLPIAVHELGHFVGPRFPDGAGGFPFRDLLEEKRQNRLREKKLSDEELEELKTQINHLNELFSDLFAVYAVGPAYACSCLLLRFNPADKTACEDSATHPGHAKRAHFILAALDQMSKSEPGRPYENVINTLKGLWSASLAAAGRAGCLSDKEAATVSYQLFQLYAMVNKHLSTVRYAGRGRARRLRDVLLSDDEPPNLLQPKDRIADVINAAWSWRLNQGQEDDDEVHRVQLKATALCREIMRH